MGENRNINEVYFKIMEKKFFTRMLTKPTYIEYKVNDDLGSGVIKRIILNKGLEFCLCKNNDFCRELLNSELDEKRFIEITYCIDGEARIKLDAENQWIHIKKGDLMFYRNHDLSQNARFHIKLNNYSGIVIGLDGDELKKLFFPECGACMLKEWDKSIASIFKGDTSFKIKAPPSIEWDMQDLLKYNYNFKEVTSLLLCQSKLIEIISKSINYGLIKRKEINLTQSDKENIYKAKDILVKNIEHPPTIEELSEMCNINSYKLKKGFKELFNNTPYGYLREMRLYKGKYLIENTENSILEIANDVGYTNPSKFSEAFKLKFNITPSECRKVNRNIESHK
ncbi:helix-turn-helix domain-containing protein [Alkaliphilus oremlandii]|uniref:Transcriptional regulator, AraC family n=1 Tax=Alkaliphilus oremlandii (strain OhILAs) TaxID=350688 RepID=A8MM75_ALKOO|nr:AraC family transcriptional regulator [Alkaliphilus oremlandii]ABW18242.1 transcriptional regulator, AraC family [Alkaliphilus oremlandii OhILAs]